MVRIADGDTITVLMHRTQRRVRLEGIDCPERGQPFSTRAREFLAGLIAGNSVELRSSGRDQYGRDLGHVYVDGKHVNAELLGAGLAWHFKRYNKDPLSPHPEAQARQAHRGLWDDKEPVPPWEWRWANRERGTR